MDGLSSSSSYGAPSSSYGAPSSSYGAPSSSYGAPSSSYTTSKNSNFGISNPGSGYDSIPRLVQAKTDQAYYIGVQYPSYNPYQ